MRPSKYEILLKVIEQGSLTRAADYFHYTQSAVSQMLKHLEEELGVSLLERTTRHMVLTRDGAHLLPVIRQLAAAEKQLTMQAAEIRELKTGVIRIGAYVSLSCFWLPHQLQMFRLRYPGVRFELKQGDSGQLCQWLADGTVDLALMMDTGDGRFEFTTLMQDQLCAVIKETDPFAALESVDLGRFAERPLILPESDYETMIRQALLKADLHPEIAYIVKEDFTIMAMVESGLGSAILPRLILQRTPFAVASIPFNTPLVRRLGIAVRKVDYLPWAVRAFIDFAVPQKQNGSVQET